MKEDRQIIVIAHLSQLLDFVTGFGGLIVPLVLWSANKERICEMDEHGKSIINFQLSIIVYALLSIPLIFLFGLGLLILITVVIFSLIYPVINAVRANNGQSPDYPLSIEFIK
jgi:uncharacterized Tic20 family protein